MAAVPHTAERERNMYFSVNRIHHGARRPHIIKAKSSGQDIASDAKLALEIQYFDLWDTTEGDDTETLTVYEAADPTWVSALTFAPWTTLSQEMRSWSVRPSLEDCCQEWFDPHIAQPLIPLMDPNCPVMKLYPALIYQKWVPVQMTLVHEGLQDKRMDCRKALTRAPYFQVLYSLEKILRIVPSVWPDQPMSYYRLLLAGIFTMPGLSDKDYKRALKEKAPAVPLADGSESEDESSEGGVAVGDVHDIPAPPPRPRAKARERRPPLPPPPVPPPPIMPPVPPIEVVEPPPPEPDTEPPEPHPSELPLPVSPEHIEDKEGVAKANDIFANIIVFFYTSIDVKLFFYFKMH